ncbi:hypothetical protein BGX27_011081 [Mortierella sp. AM989]|nr:hypothetical protein BGX27_011081 [Mortierella sp. AM989]
MATRSARTADKTTNDKHARILKALLQKPVNKYCVDCRKKVKSVDLDSWTADQVENMIKWGNENVNKYWEARLPQSSIPNENTSGIDPWIRSKYEWKQFAGKDPIPDPSELGPVDEVLLADLRGKSNSHPRAHNRLSGSSGSFGIIAPPPNNNTAVRSSFPKPPTSASGGVQGADLFSIGQSSPTTSRSAAQPDFFGLNDEPELTSPVQSQRNSLQSPQMQLPQPAQSSASQDLFSLVTPAPSGDQSGQATATTTASPAQAKAGNTDWKNSILSLYGNQPAGSNRNSTGFNIGMQQQQQQQQQQQANQFGQFQGMGTFGFGQQAQQSHQQQQQQQNLWGNNSGFGTMQQTAAPSSTTPSSFDLFANSGFGSQTSNNNFNRPTSTGSAPQGDLFSMIAGTAKSPATSPTTTTQNKNNSAFGDLTWN